jgi:hypothetical protein
MGSASSGEWPLVHIAGNCCSMQNPPTGFALPEKTLSLPSAGCPVVLPAGRVLGPRRRSRPGTSSTGLPGITPGACTPLLVGTPLVAGRLTASWMVARTGACMKYIQGGTDATSGPSSTKGSCCCWVRHRAQKPTCLRDRGKAASCRGLPAACLPVDPPTLTLSADRVNCSRRASRHQECDFHLLPRHCSFQQWFSLPAFCCDGCPSPPATAVESVSMH